MTNILRHSFLKSFLLHLFVSTVILNAIYLPVILSSFRGHDSFSIQEIFPLIYLGLACGMLSYWIATICQKSFSTALLISILVFTLPRFSLLLSGGFYAYQTFSIVLVMAAVLLLGDRTIFDHYLIRKIFIYLFLVLALFIDQANAFLFLVPTVILLIFADPKDWRRQRLIIISHVIIFIVGVWIYLLLGRDWRFLHRLTKTPAPYFRSMIPHPAFTALLFITAVVHWFKIYRGRCGDKSLDNDSQDRIGYFFIAISTLILYLISMGYSYLYHEANVPRGDPFSYTINFFGVLDLSQTHYWRTLFSVFSINNWYWLINSMIAFFSPILIKEPYSIVLVNFVIFGLAGASLFRLGRYLKFTVNESYLLSLMTWFFPSNYGFQSPVSLLQMQLDTAFLFAVVIAVINTLIYAMDVGKMKNAFFAAVTIGFAAWGRGNSLPYIMIGIAYPAVIIVKKIFVEKERGRKKNFLFNFFIFFGFVSLFCGFYYVKNWPSLSSYYAAHAAVIKQQSHINFSGVIAQIRDIPGRFWCYKESNRNGIIAGTVMSHFLILSSLLVSFCRRGVIEECNKEILRAISITGAVIFYGVFLFTIFLFNATAFYVLHIFPIMLAGMILSGFSLFGVLIKKSSLAKMYGLLPLVSVLMILYGGYFTKKHTPLDMESAAATPREVERFSRNINGILQGRSLATLWYELYSGPIINYYRIKNNLPPLYNLYYSEDYNRYLWAPPYFPENNKKIQATLKDTFEKADFFILPEFSDSYFKYEPYPLFQRSDDIMNYLNSPESPQFAVRMVLHEAGGVRLLLLQKEAEAINEGAAFEPLELPYGPSSSSGKSEYGFVPSDKSGEP